MDERKMDELAVEVIKEEKLNLTIYTCQAIRDYCIIRFMEIDDQIRVVRDPHDDDAALKEKIRQELLKIFRGTDHEG